MSTLEGLKCECGCDNGYLRVRVVYDGHAPNGFDNYDYKIVVECKKCGKRVDVCYLPTTQVLPID